MTLNHSNFCGHIRRDKDLGTVPLLWVTHHGQLAGAIRYGALVSKVDADGFSTRNPIQFDLKFFRGGKLTF